MAKRQPTTKRPTPSDAVRQRIEAQINAPDLSDFENPVYMFSTTSTDLLLAIAAGLVDPVRLARAQLANRGLDENGQWVGFDRAREIHVGGAR